MIINAEFQIYVAFAVQLNHLVRNVSSVLAFTNCQRCSKMVDIDIDTPNCSVNSVTVSRGLPSTNYFSTRLLSWKSKSVIDSVI